MKSLTLPDNFELKPISTLKGIRDMRKVRNSLAHYLTHNPDKIGLIEQWQWFNGKYIPSIMKDEMAGFVLYEKRKPVGYGLISKRRGKYWVSGGIIDGYRSMGLGYYLFTYMTRYIRFNLKQDYAYLDVDMDNTAARKLYKSIGYKAYRSKDGLSFMRYPDKINKVKVRAKK